MTTLGPRTRFLPTSYFIIFIAGCEELAKSSVEFHNALRDQKVTVIKYTKEKITNLLCRDETVEEDRKSCFGYLEEWIPSTEARLEKINEKIYDKTEDDLITGIKGYLTTSDAKQQTAADLQKIVDFMTPPDGQCTLYQQLCDLEGFFKQTGGFFVHNPVVRSKMLPEDVCHSGGKNPTNLRVLAVLKKFIKELNAPGSKSD